MLENVPPIAAGDTSSYAPTRPVGTSGQSHAVFRLETTDGIPASPPPEVLDALDAVQAAQEELDRRGLSVSFELTPQGGVSVSLRDGSGAVVQEFAPAEALEALSGEGPVSEAHP